MFDTKLMEIANELCQGCRDGREMENLDKLYDTNAVSMEAAHMPGGEMPRGFNGLEAIKAKHDWWGNAHEIHEQNVEGPFFNGPDKFSAIFDMDITNKEMNQRMQLREIATYTVKDGKIVHEEFFMAPPGM